jgi:cytochrome d ubiquinol oxidase subunit I
MGLAILGGIQVLRERLEHSPRLLRIISWMIPLPFVAVLAGWFVTEIGRQPWIIYGIMRASEAVTPSLSGWMVLATLIGYVTVYAIVFTAGITYLRRVILAGPAPEPDEGETGSAHAKRPWSVVRDDNDEPLAEGRS